MLLDKDLKLNFNVEKNKCCEADPCGIAGALRTHPTPKFQARIKEAKEQGLTELDLSSDWRTNDADKLKEIPAEVFELEQLESLNLSYNKITTIPQEITRLQNLKSLDLWSNKLREFPHVLGNLPNVVYSCL